MNREKVEDCRPRGAGSGGGLRCQGLGTGGDLRCQVGLLGLGGYGGVVGLQGCVDFGVILVEWLHQGAVGLVPLGQLVMRGLCHGIFSFH